MRNIKNRRGIRKRKTKNSRQCEISKNGWRGRKGTTFKKQKKEIGLIEDEGMRNRGMDEENICSFFLFYSSPMPRVFITLFEQF